MFTVALVGPDGSGKSLISSRLPEALAELRMKRIYMGINLEASSHMLPTTWLLLALKRAAGGRPDMAGPSDSSGHASKNPLKRLAGEVKAWFLLVNRVAEEWFRQLTAWVYQKRGYNILFDRHFFVDYYFYDMDTSATNKPIQRRIHGYLLKRFYPRPDLVIYLDAPAQLLYQRKHEGTVETIERRRQEFLRLREVFPAYEVLDTAQPAGLVIEQAAGIIRRFADRREAGSRWENSPNQDQVIS